MRGRATLARGKPTGRVESCDQWPEMWSADGACNRVRISRSILFFFNRPNAILKLGGSQVVAKAVSQRDSFSEAVL